MSKVFVSISTLLLLSLSGAPGQSNMYGIYSSIDASPGEPSGMEIFILQNGKPGTCSNSVIFQTAEGWPQYPELLDCCKCTVNHIEFVSETWGTFIGKVENDTLSGEFITAKHNIRLPKGLSFWQKQ